jgi:spore maturation protein CgeB
MKLVFFGLSITSSWGNGHATTYRALLRELNKLGHLDTARGITAFYDIDTPVTLAKLERADFEYLSPDLIPGYRIYFSFSGGRSLTRLENEYGSPAARALYCSADPELYYPAEIERRWTLGYLGTYSDDRQSALNSLLVQPALRYQWPDLQCVARVIRKK